MFFVSALSHIFEFLILFLFLEELFTYKGKRILGIAVGIGLYTIALASFVLFDSTIVNIALCFVIDFLIAKLFFDCTIRGAILSALFIAASNTASEFIVINTLGIVTDGGIQAYQSNIYMYLIMVLLSKAILFIITRAAAYMGLYLKSRQGIRTPLFLLIYPVASIAILYTFWLISSSYELPNVLSMAISCSSIAIMVSVFLTFVFYGRTSRKLDELYKSQREAERLQADKTYYALLDQQNEMLKTITHDEKNHLVAIKALANDPAVDEYIDSIYGEIKYHSMFGNTKNRYLDLMLNKYKSICDSDGITLEVNISTSNLSFMDAPDMITFVSNVLDNAVEAAGKSAAKKIYLTIKLVNGFDMFSCVNSCDTKPIVSGKVLKTTKTSDGFHGLGMKSMKSIADKYNGEFNWKYDEKEHEFTVNAVFFYRSRQNKTKTENKVN